MIDLLAAIFMAIFQGIIEWLPISSEGQLSLLFVTIYGLDGTTAVTLALLLHLGTMLSVIWFFRKDLREIVNPHSHVAQILVISKIGTAITAVPLYLFFKASWETFSKNLVLPADVLFTIAIGGLLILTGLVLTKQPEQGIREFQSITKNEAFLLGLAQGCAALPGISRSGMTLTFLLLIGLMHRDALKISFLISIPAVLGAIGLELLLEGFSVDIGGLTVNELFFPYYLLLITIILTAIVGALTIDMLIRLKDLPYDKFCIGFGSATIMLGFIFLFLRVISGS
jgi:undecaprenyl-diphosphatase